MVTLNIGNIECCTKTECAFVLEEIANAINNGYTSGITNSGVCLDFDGNEEYEDEDY